jgi:NADPH-ferrihemoprotein reductase
VYSGRFVRFVTQVMDIITAPSNLFDKQLSSIPSVFDVKTSSLFYILKPSSTADILALCLSFAIFLGLSTRGRIWDKPDPYYHVYFERPQRSKRDLKGNTSTTRNISQRLREGGHQCVIFWGSQSGTAERFAETLGRESATHFGINALVANVSDYDANSIGDIQDTHFTIFLLSTYGEGDPSDNSVGLWDWIKHVKSGGVVLENLKYIAFGLGNSNYKYYNRVLDIVVDALDAAGAHALIPPAKADDSNGGTEEDFQSWKDEVFNHIQRMGYQRKISAYQPSIKIDFVTESTGFLNSAAFPMHQQSSTNSAATWLVVRNARELFSGGDRNCVHMELDLANSDLSYKTGDHIGIWPCNPDEEVERLLGVLGLTNRRNECFTLLPHMGSTKTKIPSPMRLDIAFRHHLEICGSVARKTMLDIAEFAPTPEAKALLLDLGQDRNRYEELIAGTHITFARLLEFASPSEQWTELPLSFVIESLLPLQPRYYSISSSSIVTPRRVAVTALVVNKVLRDQSTATIHGLTSNYLLSASNLTSAAYVSRPGYVHMNHMVDPQGAKIFAHIRKSKFKLPGLPSTPIILISAGTGFAPFRGFLQERSKLQAIGNSTGKILLFFGCRNESDFIYREEIEKIQAQLGDCFQTVTAFSRDDSGQKVYVQDRIGQHAHQVIRMLEAGANMYICGKASMAREVTMKIEDAVAKAKKLNETETKAWADALKRKGKWKADVWE